MPLMRIAILVGANDASSPALRGVNSDIQGLAEHLMSDSGGAWQKSEIVWFQKPAGQQLRTFLNELRSVDYLFLAFSGHGGTDSTTLEPLVVLNDGAAPSQRYFPVEQLRAPNVARQVVLVDACRSLVNIPLKRTRIASTGAVISGGDLRNYRASCRAMFDAQLAAVPSGTVLLQSCSFGETSSDHPGGGLFTQVLLEVASRWQSTIGTGQWASSVLSICDAFNAADNHTRTQAQRFSREQSPTSLVYGGAGLLPFAIA